MNVPRRSAVLLTAALAATALSGCSPAVETVSMIRDTAGAVGRDSDTGPDFFTGTAGPDLFTADGISTAYSAIADRAGAHPLQVVEVTIVPGAVTVQAVDPTAPTELNQWQFSAATVPPPRPVDYDDDVEALRQNLFAVDDVPAQNIATAISGAVAASGIADGEVSSLTIHRNLPFDENVVMFINVSGERSSKQVRADVSGHITEVI